MTFYIYHPSIFICHVPGVMFKLLLLTNLQKKIYYILEVTFSVLLVVVFIHFNPIIMLTLQVYEINFALNKM